MASYLSESFSSSSDDFDDSFSVCSSGSSYEILSENSDSPSAECATEDISQIQPIGVKLYMFDQVTRSRISSKQ